MLGCKERDQVGFDRFLQCDTFELDVGICWPDGFDEVCRFGYFTGSQRAERMLLGGFLPSNQTKGAEDLFYRHGS